MLNSPDDQVVTLSPQLDVRRLEITPSPMLDLIELRYREPDGTVAAEFVDRNEARKFAAQLLAGIGALNEYEHQNGRSEGAVAAPAREEADAA